MLINYGDSMEEVSILFSEENDFTLYKSSGHKKKYFLRVFRSKTGPEEELVRLHVELVDIIEELTSEELAGVVTDYRLVFWP